MNLPYRIDLLVRLGEYILSDEPAWQQAKEKAGQENGWFIPEFIELAALNIARSFLQKRILEKWIDNYNPVIPSNRVIPFSTGTGGRVGSNLPPKIVGIVMAGNIPFAGFHDFLCVFISGHKASIKLSSKDNVLIKHLTEKLGEWSARTPSEDAEINNFVRFSEMLKGCDAYIATGSNNSSGYFEYYFGKYPHIIRRNRTSVAILTGEETNDELEKLANDVYQYFGLGCRNVTKIYAPASYDFVPLLTAFNKYNYLADHQKYKNNYDYNLTLHILNKKYYMTNGSILLIEDSSLFSPISQLNYEFYGDKKELISSLQSHQDLQCIIGKGLIPFGQAQYPAINDYADGVDTLKFLTSL